MILNENLFENSLTESIHELVKIKVPGYTNTWTSFDNYDITIAPGVVKRYFILENDKWGDETWSLVVSEDLSEVYETYDDIETCLRDEGIIDNLSESIEGESNWDKIMHVLNAEDNDELEEDIKKTSKGKWVNRGKEGTHGEFETKKAAREQQKAIFASGWKGESLDGSADRKHSFEDFYDQFDIKPERKIKEVYAEISPEEYQLDKIHPTKTIANIWSEMQAGEDFYRIASKDGEGFDSAVREGIFEIISKAFKIPYNTVYLTWRNGGKLEKTFKVVDKDGKKVPQGGGFTSKKEAEMFATRYGEKDLEVVKESFEDEHLGIKENIGSDIAEYQKWVDYDMKKYGKISDDTNEKIKKAGLKIVKDDHNDYEVIANEPNHDVTEALYQTKTLSGTPISFEVEDKKLIIKENGKVIIETEITDPESLKAQISSMSTVKTISEDVDPNGPKIKDNGIAQMLIDAINGEWDTIKLYNDIIVNAETYSYPDIANVVRDISDEEMLHVGQLQAALDTVSPNISSIQDGQEEAEKQLDDTTESSELKDYEEQK